MDVIKRNELLAEPSGFIVPGIPLYHLAKEYLTLLQRSEKQKAIKLIRGAILEGIPVRDIYLQIFQPVLYEIGRLWELNKVSIAQEHYCSALTQLIMSQLYPVIPGIDKVPYKFVGVCTAGELHEIGLRMVCDFLEMQGWETYYFGANVPTDELIPLVREREPDILGISATLTYHVPVVNELIKKFRSEADFQHIKVSVGGYPFNLNDELWRQVGADAFARDAAEAVQIAKQLVRLKLGGINR